MKHPELQATIVDLQSHEKPIWKRVAKDLSKPTRIRRSVNLSRINQFAKDGETVVVPGKVLATGVVTKSITIICYQCSDAAEQKIKAAGGKILSLQEGVKASPAKMRIIG